MRLLFFARSYTESHRAVHGPQTELITYSMDPACTVVASCPSPSRRRAQPVSSLPTSSQSTITSPSSSPSQRTLPYTGHCPRPGSHRWHLPFLPNAWHPLVPLPYQAVPLSFDPSDRYIFSSVNSVTCVLSSFPCISVYPSSYDRDPCGVFLRVAGRSEFLLALRPGSETHLGFVYTLGYFEIHHVLLAVFQ